MFESHWKSQGLTCQNSKDMLRRPLHQGLVMAGPGYLSGRKFTSDKSLQRLEVTSCIGYKSILKRYTLTCPEASPPKPHHLQREPQRLHGPSLKSTGAWRALRMPYALFILFHQVPPHCLKLGWAPNSTQFATTWFQFRLGDLMMYEVWDGMRHITRAYAWLSAHMKNRSRC